MAVGRQHQHPFTEANGSTSAEQSSVSGVMKEVHHCVANCVPLVLVREKKSVWEQGWRAWARERADEDA